MEKEIVEKLCSKYGKSQNLIEIMVKSTLKENASLENTFDLICKFYQNKCMQ